MKKLGSNLSSPALLLVTSLAACLFIPDFSSNVLVDEMSFKFLSSISETGFYLMLCLLSMFWSYFAYIHGTKVFSFKKLFLLILSIPLTILIYVVSSGLFSLFFIHFFINWATAANMISQCFSAIYKIFDLIIIGLFLFFVYSTVKTKLNDRKDRVFSLLSFFCCVITALVFLLFASAALSVCNSLECREKDLRSALGEDVYQAVDKYLKSSPVILKDLGQVKKIANQSGQKVIESGWQDYYAKMNLELTGDRGTGFLELVVAGNNFKSLEIFNGIWKFNGNSTPIGSDGNIVKGLVRGYFLSNSLNQLPNIVRHC